MAEISLGEQLVHERRKHLQAMLAGALFEPLLLTSTDLVLYATVQKRVWVVAPRVACRTTSYNYLPYLAPRRARVAGVTANGLRLFTMDQNLAVVLL